MTPTLWHYTCDHGRAGLGQFGTLRAPIDLIRADRRVTDGFRDFLSIIWLTDLEYPSRSVLGLTHYTIKCNRIQYRYRVLDTSHVRPWTEHRHRIRGSIREQLEGQIGVMPRHWYVATVPVPVTFDPVLAVTHEHT